MAGILKGIGQKIGQLWKVEEKPIPDSLEDQINRALSSEREKITATQEDINWYSWVTKDNNPIHRLKKKAMKLGFKDIPLMGAHVAAYGEQFIEAVVKNMIEYWGADIKIIGQYNHFTAEVNPGDKINWQVVDYKDYAGGIKLFTKGCVKGTGVIDITSILGKEYPLMPQIAGPILNVSRKYLIEQDHLEAFYNCVGGKMNEEVPNMLPASLVPATLLSLLEERTQTSEGMNISMDFDFLKRAEPGAMQVDLFPPRKPKAQKREGLDVIDYIYKFKAVVSQKSKPITYGEVISSTRYNVVF